MFSLRIALFITSVHMSVFASFASHDYSRHATVPNYKISTTDQSNEVPESKKSSFIRWLNQYKLLITCASLMISGAFYGLYQHYAPQKHLPDEQTINAHEQSQEAREVRSSQRVTRHLGRDHRGGPLTHHVSKETGGRRDNQLIRLQRTDKPQEPPKGRNRNPLLNKFPDKIRGISNTGNVVQINVPYQFSDVIQNIIKSGGPCGHLSIAFTKIVQDTLNAHKEAITDDVIGELYTKFNNPALYRDLVLATVKERLKYGKAEGAWMSIDEVRTFLEKYTIKCRVICNRAIVYPGLPHENF